MNLTALSYVLSRTIIFTIESLDIVKAVCIVHECYSTEICQPIDTDCFQQVEREDVTAPGWKGMRARGLLSKIRVFLCQNSRVLLHA